MKGIWETVAGVVIIAVLVVVLYVKFGTDTKATGVTANTNMKAVDTSVTTLATPIP